MDTVEVAVIPVLLGGGIPLLPHPGRQAKLTLAGHRVYGTGIVLLEYNVGAPPTRSQRAKSRRARKT